MIDEAIDRQGQVRALANPTRLEILRILTDPGLHFSGQVSADPVKIGVCVQLLAEHFEVSQPTMSRHVDLLRRAGFLRATRQKKWTYCSRNEGALSDYVDWFARSLQIEKD